MHIKINIHIHIDFLIQYASLPAIVCAVSCVHVQYLSALVRGCMSEIRRCMEEARRHMEGVTSNVRVAMESWIQHAEEMSGNHRMALDDQVVNRLREMEMNMAARFIPIGLAMENMLERLTAVDAVSAQCICRTQDLYDNSQRLAQQVALLESFQMQHTVQVHESDVVSVRAMMPYA